VKRFLKVFVLLIVSLLLLASGLNAALDHYSTAVSQNSVSLCDEKGSTLVAYNGDLNVVKSFGKPMGPVFLHRT
jgi:hypothetical protein